MGKIPGPNPSQPVDSEHSCIGHRVHSLRQVCLILFQALYYLLHFFSGCTLIYRIRLTERIHKDTVFKNGCLTTAWVMSSLVPPSSTHLLPQHPGLLWSIVPAPALAAWQQLTCGIACSKHSTVLLSRQPKQAANAINPRLHTDLHSFTKRHHVFNWHCPSVLNIYDNIFLKLTKSGTNHIQRGPGCCHKCHIT